MHASSALLCALLISSSLLAQDAARADLASLDKTGIHWISPFTAALAKARKEKRLLLFLPLAGGSNAKGNW